MVLIDIFVDRDIGFQQPHVRDAGRPVSESGGSEARFRRGRGVVAGDEVVPGQGAAHAGREPGQDLEVHRQAALAVVAALVHVDLLDFGKRVVIHVGEELEIAAVRVVNGDRRVEVIDITPDVAVVGEVFPVFVGAHEGEVHREPVVDGFLDEGDVRVEALQVVFLHDTLAVQIGDAGPILALARAAGKADAMALRASQPRDHLLPVGAGAIVDGAGDVVFRDIGPPVFGRHHVQQLFRLLDGEIAVIGYGRLAFLALFRRDDNHAVGRAGAVNGCGRGIFQHGDGGNILRGNQVHGRTRDAVDDDQRPVAAQQGGRSAQAQGGFRRGVAARLGHDQARHLSGDHIGRGGDDTLVELLLGDVDDGSGEVFLPDGAIADHHDILQGLGIRSEDGVQPPRYGDGQRHGLHPEAGKFDSPGHLRLLGGERQDILAVRTGHRHRFRGLDDLYPGCNHRKAVAVCDRSPDFPCLRHGGQCRQHCRHSGQKFRFQEHSIFN